MYFVTMVYFYSYLNLPLYTNARLQTSIKIQRAQLYREKQNPKANNQQVLSSFATI